MTVPEYDEVYAALWPRLSSRLFQGRPSSASNDHRSAGWITWRWRISGRTRGANLFALDPPEPVTSYFAKLEPGNSVLQYAFYIACLREIRR